MSSMKKASHVVYIEDCFGADSHFLYPCTSFNSDALSSRPVNSGVYDGLHDTSTSNQLINSRSDETQRVHLPKECPRKVSSWSVDQVAEFLQLNGFSEQAEFLRKEEVDGSCLELINIKDLEAIFHDAPKRVPRGILLRISRALQLARQGCFASTPDRPVFSREKFRVVVTVNSSISTLEFATMIGKTFSNVSCMQYHVPGDHFALGRGENVEGGFAEFSLIRQMDFRNATLIDVSQYNAQSAWGVTLGTGYMASISLNLMFESATMCMHELQETWSERVPFAKTRLEQPRFNNQSFRHVPVSSLILCPKRNIRQHVMWTKETLQFGKKTMALYPTHIRQVAFTLFCIRRHCRYHLMSKLDIHVLQMIIEHVVRSSAGNTTCLWVDVHYDKKTSFQSTAPLPPLTRMDAFEAPAPLPVFDFGLERANEGVIDQTPPFLRFPVLEAPINDEN